jgi:quercetin dioxygenase-like cupin family protein
MTSMESLYGRLLVDFKHSTELENGTVLTLLTVEVAPDVVEPADTHPGPEVLYCLAGQGHVDVDGQQTRLSPGEAALVPEGAISPSWQSRCSTNPSRRTP